MDSDEATLLFNIVAKIRELRNAGKPDNEVDEAVRSQFPDFSFTFGNCSFIDQFLTANPSSRGGFWRSSYNYPKLGDRVNMSCIGGCVDELVDEVGFFTFSARV